MQARTGPVKYSTKDKIFDVAIQLFSEEGYKEVSMRDIAKAVGINVSSIYNHFLSKEDILHSLYDFYEIHWRRSSHHVDELLALAETEEPLEVLMHLDFRFDESVEERMTSILKIASRLIEVDERSEGLFREHVFGGSTDALALVIERMIELDRIEPVNVKTLASLLAYHSAGAALLNHTTLGIGLQQWRDNLALVFSLVRPTGK